MVERKLYDANLRALEVELEMAGFPDDVTWLLRNEMPWSRRPGFSVPFETCAFGCNLRGVLYFDMEGISGFYRFAAFDLQIVYGAAGADGMCRFERTEEDGVDLREAVNLMLGRPVYRELIPGLTEGYWLDLDRSEMQYSICHNPSKFLVTTALDKGFFRKKLGSEECMRVAGMLERGDRIRMEINSKPVFVEVDLLNERLLLTNAEGKPSTVNWWNIFIKRK